MSKIIIKEMNIYDYDSLIELWNLAGLKHSPNGRDSREHISKEMLNSTTVFFGAFHKETLAGSIIVTSDGRKGWLNRLAVLPRFRRQGVAQMLIQTSEEYLTKSGLEIFSCLILDDNTASRTLFEKSGYSSIPVKYYFKKTNNNI